MQWDFLDDKIIQGHHYQLVSGPPMIIREIYARSILSKSRVFDYVVNPYIGCQHRCTYCYARFMKRFTRHKELWGEFADVKVNAPDLLERGIEKTPPRRVWVSGVCDPHQPVERRLQVTRKCIEIIGPA